MLSDVFHNPQRVKADNKFNEFLYAMVYQAANEMNTGVSTQVSNSFVFCTGTEEVYVNRSVSRELLENFFGP